MDVRDILYNAINNYKEYRIVSDIIQGNSSEALNAICNECMPLLENLEGSKSENLISFAESFIHYLLTVALIPSQRKTVHAGIEIDVVIPDVRTLASSPQDAIIVTFPKTNDHKFIQKQVAEITKIQPYKDNMWFILENTLPLEARVYIINQNEKTYFTNIINDIIGFLSNKKQSKLKLFRI